MMSSTPSSKGEEAEGAALAALLRTGMTVLLPFGGSHRFDLVVLAEGVFRRVQVKTGRIRKGVVQFNTCSNTGGTRKGYADEADLFAVYEPTTGAVYLVPVEDMPTTVGCLRLDPSKNGQSVGVRWADEYKL